MCEYEICIFKKKNKIMEMLLMLGIDNNDIWKCNEQKANPGLEIHSRQ